MKLNTIFVHTDFRVLHSFFEYECRPMIGEFVFVGATRFRIARIDHCESGTMIVRANEYDC